MLGIVFFIEIQAAFGMADQHDVHAHISQHFGGHFAGIRAFVGKTANVLGADVDFIVLSPQFISELIS